MNENILLTDYRCLIEGGQEAMKAEGIDGVLPVLGWHQTEDSLQDLGLVPHVLAINLQETETRPLMSWLRHNTRIEPEEVHANLTGKNATRNVLEQLHPDIFVTGEPVAWQTALATSVASGVILMGGQNGLKFVREGYDGWQDIVRLIDQK